MEKSIPVVPSYVILVLVGMTLTDHGTLIAAAGIGILLCNVPFLTLGYLSLAGGPCVIRPLSG